jgi:hypothetical protein
VTITFDGSHSAGVRGQRPRPPLEAVGRLLLTVVGKDEPYTLGTERDCAGVVCYRVQADPASARAAGIGTYLMKYGAADTEWVPLPLPSVGPHTHPVADLSPVGSEGDVVTTVGGVAVWSAPSSSSYADSIFSGGQDGAINFNGSATTVATLAGSTYTLTQNVAATDIVVASGYVVVTAGYAMFWTGTLSGSGTIRNNGSAGTSISAAGTVGTGGAGAPASTLPGGGAGGNGAINNASSPGAGTGSSSAPMWNPVGAGGAGGANTGGAGSTGGTCKGGGSGGRKGYSVGAQAGTAGASVGSVNSDSAYMQCLATGRNVGGALFGGSTGGAGAPSPDTYNDFIAPQGTDGAGGGGAGGWMVLAGNHCTFTGTVESKGGAGGFGYSFNVGGASGGSGGPGAGGGPGGTIIFFIGTGTLPTFDVSGGAGRRHGAFSSGIFSPRASALERPEVFRLAIVVVTIATAVARLFDREVAARWRERVDRDHARPAAVAAGLIPIRRCVFHRVTSTSECPRDRAASSSGARLRDRAVRRTSA